MVEQSQSSAVRLSLTWKAGYSVLSSSGIWSPVQHLSRPCKVHRALARRLAEPLHLLLPLEVGPGSALPTQGGAARPAGGRSPSFHLVHRPNS